MGRIIFCVKDGLVSHSIGILKLYSARPFDSESDREEPGNTTKIPSAIRSKVPRKRSLCDFCWVDFLMMTSICEEIDINLAMSSQIELTIWCPIIILTLLFFV